MSSAPHAPLFSFDNSYARLPERFFARVAPAPVAEPRVVRVNESLAQLLGADPERLAGPDGPHRNRCRSWLGLVRVRLGDTDGIHLCRRAAWFEDDSTEILYNLAAAELVLGERLRARDAIRRGLQHLQDERPLQRLPSVTSLPRDAMDG
jgi:hypothetical protein